MEIYGSVKLRGSLEDGTGDSLLTKDASTDNLGTVASALGTLASAHIFVGNGSSVPTDVAVTGDVTISNTGVTAIASGVIVNADINGSAAIAVSKLATITASRALVSDGSGFIAAATTTATEIGFISGLTSSAQTQINTKQATITGAATTITSSDLTVNRALLSNGSGKVAVSTVTNTELGYLSGVSSALQTQINTKLTAVITSAVEGDIIYFNGTNWVDLARGTNGQVLQSTASTIQWGAATSNGLPVGGSTGQALVKTSGSDFAVGWSTLVTASITDITASAAELNIMDGVVASTAEINFLDNVSANVQTQLNGKLSTSLATDSILKGVGGVATATTDLPTGTTIGSAVIYRVGGTDVTLADGGTGASLADPGADRIMFWDESANAVTWLTPSTGLAITTTSIALDTAYITSGTYTPTFTVTANCSSPTAFDAQYIRVGSVVTVSGRVGLTVTSGATTTSCGVSLPFASNLTGTWECSGTGNEHLGNVAGVIIGDATNDRAELVFTSGATGVHGYAFTFTYKII